MKPSGWHPPQADNTHTLYMGDQHRLIRNSVGFLFSFFFPSVPVCLSTVNDYYMAQLYICQIGFSAKNKHKILLHKNWERDNGIRV